LLRRYVIAQILGAYIAALVVYNQWKPLIDVAEETLLKAGPAIFAATQFTPNGPPGAFANYLLAGQTLPRVFMNEVVNVSNFFPWITKTKNVIAVMISAL
jgi:glycerol uptake facilitator-like aquaporin